MEKRRAAKSKALTVTFCGVMVALGAGIMLAGGLFGVLTYAAPLLASLCLIPVIREFGSGKAWLAWLATAILSVLVSADKEEAFFYVFVGFYPMLRPLFMRIRPKIPRLLLKLGFFTAAVAAMYSVLCFLLKADQVLEELKDLGTALVALLFSGLVLILLVYDLMVKYAGLIYEKRLRKKLRFLGAKEGEK